MSFASPLNAILGFAQLMDGDAPPPTPPRSASIEQILKAGWYLLELINEILDLAQIESGKLSMSQEPTVANRGDARMPGHDRAAGAKSATSSVTFPDIDIPYFVDADRTRLKQVLINLLSNAIKYNQPHGTVVVDCACRPAHHAETHSRQHQRHRRRDCLLRSWLQLFQPFNRLGQEQSDEEGTGIGLVMSKRLVELMGGVIGVDSTVGAGSVFWFELIAAAAPQLPADDTEHGTAFGKRKSRTARARVPCSTSRTTRRTCSWSNTSSRAAPICAC